MTAYQRLLALGYSSTVVLNMAAWLVILLLLNHNQVVTILHYNIFFGPDVFGQWYELLILPGLGLVIALIDLLLTVWLWRKDQFLSYVATMGAVATQLILLTATALMININRT